MIFQSSTVHISEDQKLSYFERIKIFLSDEIFKDFLEDANEVLPYSLPVLPKKELYTSMHPKPPTEVAIMLPKASFCTTNMGF